MADTSTAPALWAPRPRGLSGRALTAGIFWMVIAANAGVIVWLWLYGGGVSAVHGLGDLWTSIGRITGLISAYLALIQVLLLSRLPWIERLAGFDRLTVWHRLNGKICLLLVVAHAVFITIGYASMDQIGVLLELSRLLGNYPGMVAATVGTVMMIVVVITSLVILRRRLRYESWYAVHLMAYAGIALAWVHQIPTGNEFTANATAAAYWTSLYVATVAILVWFRLMTPAVQLLRYRLRVAEVVHEAPNVVSVRITGRGLHRLGAHGGQFFLWRFLSKGRWWQSHPFSLSEAPNGRSLRITAKQVGDFTQALDRLRPGTWVIAEGPFGVFSEASRTRDRVALIAGGIGITPIRAILEEMPADIAVIYRVIREEEIVFRQELEALAHRRGAALHYVVGDHQGLQGKFLLSVEHLLQLIPDLTERECFVCGPPPMMALAEQNLLRAGVHQQQIHSERFAL